MARLVRAKTRQRPVSLASSGVPHVVIYEVHDRGFQRRGEEQGLALFRQDGCDPANRGKKSHVQHAVGLVENQDSQIAKIEELAIEEVLQTAGRGDD